MHLEEKKYSGGGGVGGVYRLRFQTASEKVADSYPGVIKEPQHKRIAYKCLIVVLIPRGYIREVEMTPFSI